MSKFLYVKGNDYAALNFEEKYNPQEFYNQMVVENVTEKILKDDFYAEVEIKEFGVIDPDFLSFVQHELRDYDDTKHWDIFEVN